LTAAKIVGETAQVHRFRSKDTFARHNGDGGMEALRILKRRLPDVVYRAMLTDQQQSSPAAA
jgi:ribosomal protein S4